MIVCTENPIASQETGVYTPISSNT